MLAVAITLVAAALAGALGFRLGTRSDRRYDVILRLLEDQMTSVAGTLHGLADRLSVARVQPEVEVHLAGELASLLEQIAAEGAPAQAFRRVGAELRPELAGAPHVLRIKQPETRDELTGLRDRRGYESELEREIARARRTNRPLAVAVFDLGDLAEARVQTGHAAVDTLLQEFGALLAELLASRTPSADPVPRTSVSCSRTRPRRPLARFGRGSAARPLHGTPGRSDPSRSRAASPSGTPTRMPTRSAHAPSPRSDRSARSGRSAHRNFRGAAYGQRPLA